MQLVAKFWVLFLLFHLVNFQLVFVIACFPGKSNYRSRHRKPSVPMILHERIPPNSHELNQRASGPADGRLHEGSPGFARLVTNYNPDIVFRDDEHTGEDRIMSRRCKEKLNNLAFLVMHKWPRVRLRVIDAWSSRGHYPPESLHYEGRAVDITTDDKDRNKYGMLGRLAYRAGFDYVFYVTRGHIHASVKSDTAPGGRLRGCFPENAQVITPAGKTSMKSISVGDKVLSMSQETGKLEFSPILLFAHHSPGISEEFIEIETAESVKSLILTPYHLIGRSVTNSSAIEHVFASNVNLGDYIQLAVSAGNVSDSAYSRQLTVIRSSVTRLRKIRKKGLFAPITASGTILVNDIVATCYAATDSSKLAHAAFAPVRWLYSWLGVVLPPSSDSSDIHWYSKFLIWVSEIVLGWRWS